MAGEDKARLAWIRTQPCCGPHVPGDCEGRTEAHHAGARPGVGMKAADDTAIPLSTGCHRAWHNASGPFRGMDKADRRTWSDAQIQRFRKMYEADANRLSEDLPF